MTQPTHTPAIKLGNSADWFNDNVQKHIDQIPQPYKAIYDAAPELLEALEENISIWKYLTDDELNVAGSILKGITTKQGQSIVKARKAIAKARG